MQAFWREKLKIEFLGKILNTLGDSRDIHDS